MGVAKPGITIGTWSSGARFCTPGRGWNPKASAVTVGEDLWPTVSITVHLSHHSAPVPHPTQLCFSTFPVCHNFWCEHKRRVSRKNKLQHCRCSHL